MVNIITEHVRGTVEYVASRDYRYDLPNGTLAGSEALVGFFIFFWGGCVGG